MRHTNDAQRLKGGRVTSREQLDAALDESLSTGAPGSRVDLSGFEHSEIALVRLHELLRFPAVAVPADFADQVMARVQAEPSRSTAASPVASTRSRLMAIAGAVLLLGLVAVLASNAGAGEESVLAGLANGLSSVALAGAGLLAATWSGVGTTVGSWLGTSPTMGAFLALAFVGVALGFAAGLRRSRSTSRSD